MDGSVVGVDVGATKLLGGRVEADGRVGARSERPTTAASAAAILEEIAQLVAELVAPDTAGVGVGMPGTIDQEAGRLVHAVNLPIGDVPIRARLAELVGLPVELDNDGNCAALGEHAHGAARGTRHSVTLTLGTGVGGGVVSDDRLLHGARGAGMELGHLVIDRNGPPCQGSCPGRGHLEGYCSGTAVSRVGRERGIGDAHAVLTAARRGDAAALDVLAAAASALGTGLVTLANVFGPEVIVIGGGFGDAAASFLIEPATARMRAEAMRPMQAANVVTASLGNEAGMIGAAELVRRRP